MARAIALGAEVAGVVRVQRGDGGDALADADAFLLQAGDLQRIVGDEVHGRDAELLQDRRRDVVSPQVVRETEGAVGLVGVGAARLQRVSANLVAEPDAAAFLAQVENDAAGRGADQGQGVLQLITAVAFQAAQDLAGEALAVDADGHSLATAHLALDRGDVLLVRAALAEDDYPEQPVAGGQRRSRIDVDWRVGTTQRAQQRSGLIVPQDGPPSRRRHETLREPERFRNRSNRSQGCATPAQTREATGPPAHPRWTVLRGVHARDPGRVQLRRRAP